MNLYCIDNGFYYELENTVRLFMPDGKITVIKELRKEPEIPYAVAGYDEKNRRVFARLNISGSETELEKPLPKEDADAGAERILAAALFELLCAEFKYRPEWGILTGVRPGKLMGSLKKSLGDKAALDYFENELYVSRKKARLALEVASAQEKIVALSSPKSFSLYISIPFCPSRCSYCSFVSHSVSSPALKKSIPRYVDLMCEEIKLTGKIAAENGLRLESVYWGGGTPTVLDSPLLSDIFEAVGESFDLKTVREYTVEAGRPDTVTKEKLHTLKKYGVSRVCINPQTFSDEVLNNIGRRHTGAQSAQAYALVREAGFESVNADLIAALPGDTPEGFERSVKTAIEMGFESVTVHTLAKKRSSALAADKLEILQNAPFTRRMLELAETLLRGAAYKPYYMYRQSKSSGNFENVGWAKAGKECLYNVFMMEECHSVLAVGAGAVTKLKEPYGSYIERVYNFKYPYEYISRFEEVLARKNRISEFCGTYFIQGDGRWQK